MVMNNTSALKSGALHEVVIVAVARTPFGAFQGALSSLPATRLGSITIAAALQRAGIVGNLVSEVIMGNVLAAGAGQAPARQASIGAGIPDSVPTLTINKVCGSGMKALMLGAQAIRLGDSDIVVAGGMESMSQAPYLIPNARSGLRMGHQQLIDSMVHDGLWDPYGQQHMGSCAERCAKDRDFSRQQQDDYAIRSFRRAQAAQKAGKFNEITPVTIAGRKGEATVISEDESPGKAQFEKIPTLKPAFDPNGTITAANASSVNDGAVAIVLMSFERAQQLGVKPLARLVSSAVHAHEPLWFTTAPIEAMRRALNLAKWQVQDTDLFEINEAFAVVPLVAQRELQIPDDKLNVWGGAIALGHPIGASGARIVATLCSALIDRGLSRGVASICIGGGEAAAVCLEKMP